jgi:hypothetical protein
VINVIAEVNTPPGEIQMKTYTIENETNNITIYATKQEAEAVPASECFANEAALAKLAANWPAARLVEIWNSLPGETPVKKFKDRSTAVARIWKAIQRLSQMSAEALDDADWNRAKAGPVSKGPEPAPTPQPSTAPVEPQSPQVAAEKAPAKTRAKRAKKAPVAAAKPKGTREGSKISRVIEMLKREGGVTLTELMKEMCWQQHTTRALMSAGGSLAKKHGITVVSTKAENGDRTY